MKRISLATSATLGIDAVVLAICLGSVAFLQERATVPFKARDHDGRILVSEVMQPASVRGLQPADRLMTWNGRPLPTADALEFVANRLPIGTIVTLEVMRADTLDRAETTLVPAYGSGYWAVVSLIGLACVGLALFVLLARPGDPAAMLLHWAMFWLGTVVMVAYEGTPPGRPLSPFGSVLFFLSYMGTAVSFFLFTLRFPRPVSPAPAWWSVPAAAPGILLAGITALQFLRASRAGTNEAFLAYNALYDIFHAGVLAYAAAGVGLVIHSYRRAASSEDRKKLQWVVWGFAVGPTPFLLLSVLPQFFQPEGLVPEVYTLPFLVLVPFALVVSFIRHRLMDIELVIRRTTAYFLVLALLLALYLGVVVSVAAAVGQLTASAAAAVIVALLFDPLKVRMQRGVDRLFFRVQYDLRLAQKRMIDEIRGSLDEAGMARQLASGIPDLIPVEALGIFASSAGRDALKLLAGAGIPPATELPPPPGLRTACTRGVPLACDGALEPGLPCVHADAMHSDTPRWTLMVPMPSHAGGVAGVIALGPKKAGTRFTQSDLDLLGMLALQAGLGLQRFGLQRTLLAEKEETDRLTALNRLKSDFVSYVSHELRTPLTAIKMFAELLASPARGLDAKGKGYLAIIEGEADRLGRMVSTILDSARIDQGGKLYTMKSIDLRNVADTAMAAMHFQLEIQHFSVRYTRSRSSVPVTADQDALVDALINLVGNAIKYSAGVKRLRVKVGRRDGYALCSVEDRGVGISTEALPHLFEKFYRDPRNSGRVQGVGLGLPLVKHIIDAHNGSITVTSAPGRGSLFVLRLPLAVAAVRARLPRRTAHEHHPRHR